MKNKKKNYQSKRKQKNNKENENERESVLPFAQLKFCHPRVSQAALRYPNCLPFSTLAYFLGLLAKIKCSICSYDCEKSYGRHCLPDFHNNISSQGLRVRNLLQPFPAVFLALHSSLVTLTLNWVPKKKKKIYNE